MDKALKKYAKIYRTALRANRFSDIDIRVGDYKERLQEMYTSQVFMQHNVYPTMDVTKIYAVIAMCLELKKENLSDKEIIDVVNSGFEKLRKMFEYYGIRGLCKIFCITDETAYSNLTRHVKFIRHSDLSDGKCCHDEVIDRKYIG